ncbi:hypothetical protein BG005_010769 [Podila minutissima]|nr:hypothetical protein BG005_010769 [Podila minutissima]
MSTDASQASSLTITVPLKSTPVIERASPPIQEASTAAILALPNEVAGSIPSDQESSTYSAHCTKSAEISPTSTPKRILFALHSPLFFVASGIVKKKKPRNSFMMYRKDKAETNRAQYKAAKLSSSQISSEVGRLWALEPESVKRQYETQADHEKLLYDQDGALPQYSYRPARRPSLFPPTSPRSTSTKSPSSSPTSRTRSSFSESDPTSPPSSARHSTTLGKAGFTTAPQFIIPPLTLSSLPPKPPSAMTGMFSAWDQPPSPGSTASSSSGSSPSASLTSATSQSLHYERIKLGLSRGGPKSGTHGSGRKFVRSKKPSASKTAQQSPPLIQLSELQIGAGKEGREGGEHEATPSLESLSLQVAFPMTERHHDQEQKDQDTVMTSPLVSRRPLE